MHSRACTGFALVLALAMWFGTVVSSVAAQAVQAGQKGPSGLALPRFVSLKSDRVNMRAGPGTQYPTTWVYRRAGLPMEVIREFKSWRQVRDSEGARGWVLASLLSGRRTALVEPWRVKPGQRPAQIALKSTDQAGSADVVKIEVGVIANVQSCDGRWCVVAIRGFRGYVEQNRLWGVYKGETGRW